MYDRIGEPPQNGFEPRNWVLASLPPEDLCSLRQHLEAAALPRGKILLEADEALTHAYFVETGVVALVTVFRSGATAVSALAGREGVVGVGALLGGEVEVGRYVVHVTGSALIMDASRFRAALRQTPRLRTTCQAYASALLGQVLQNTACHSTHTVAERCARSLLMIHDRSNGDTLALTHESLAQMLGVPGPNAASVTRTLQKAGMVRCSQEGIRVLDRARLEAAACECYGIDRAHYDCAGRRRSPVARLTSNTARTGRPRHALVRPVTSLRGPILGEAALLTPERGDFLTVRSIAGLIPAPPVQNGPVPEQRERLVRNLRTISCFRKVV